MPSRPKVVAFDIIGTVFSLEPVREKLVGLGLPHRSLELLYWAALRDSFGLACSNSFAPFLTTLEGALDELLAIEKLTASSGQKNDVLHTLSELPAHDDAGQAFEILTDAGIRIFALSNGAASSTEALLKKAGLRHMVEQVLSVEAVKLSKPRPEVYLYASRAAAVRPDEMALGASHAWDVQGAMKADLIGGYVARGIPFPSALGAPDLTGESLAEVAQALTRL